MSFDPQTIPAPGSGSSTMTITVGAGTATGTYPFTVTGIGGGVQQNTTFTLTVTSQQAPPNGIIGYSFTSGNIPSQAAFKTWLASNFSFVVGAPEENGFDLSPYSAAWTGYVDSCCVYVPDIYQFVLATAANQGWSDPEGPILHMTTDYAVSGGMNRYSGIEQFDAYEKAPGRGGWAGQPVDSRNGIFTLVGSTYTDVTVQAFCPTSGVPTDYWATARAIRRTR